jgi:hypothetical protein
MRDKRSAVPLVVASAALLLLIPMLYIISIGPAWRLYHRGTIRRDTFYAVYLPALRVAAKQHTIKKVVEDYGALWLCDWPPQGGSKPELSSE